MSNTCFNTIKVDGPRKKLDKLSALVVDIRSNRTECWDLYNLLRRLGYTDKYARSREIRECFSDTPVLENGVLTFHTESAWYFQGSGWESVRRKLRGIRIYHLSEELGCGIFETNDDAGMHFNEKYILDYSDGEDGGTEYLADDDALVSFVKEHFCQSVTDIQSVHTFLSSMDDFNEKECQYDRYALLYEVEYEHSYNLN